MQRECSDVPIFASAMLVTLSPTNLPALERHAKNRLHFRYLSRHWAAYIFQHFTNAKNNALVLLSFWLSFYLQRFYLRSLTLDFRLVNLWLLQKNLFFSFSAEERQNQRKTITAPKHVGNNHQYMRPIGLTHCIVNQSDWRKITSCFCLCVLGSPTHHCLISGSGNCVHWPTIVSRSPRFLSHSSLIIALSCQ